jgi:AsmA protein
MNSILKWIAIAAATVIVLIVVAVLLVSSLVDEEQIKSTLVATANERLNGELAIDGELSLSLWPALAVAVHDIRLRSNSDPAETLAAASEIRLGLELVPLLRRELSVGELILSDLVLRLQRDGAGRANWEGLARSGSDGQNATTAPDPAAAAASPMLLAVDVVRIDNGTVEYADLAENTRYALRQLSLAGRGVNLRGDPFALNLETDAQFDAEAKPLRLRLEARVGVNAEAGGIAIESGSIALQPADGPSIDLALRRAHIALDARKAEIPDWTLRSQAIASAGALAADWSNAGAPAATGSIDVESLDLPALLTAFERPLPPGINPEPLEKMSLATRFELRDRALNLPDLRLGAGRFRGNVAARIMLGDTPRTTLKIESEELDLDYFFPPAPDDAEAAQTPSDAPAGETTEAAAAAGLPLTQHADIDAALGRLRASGLEMSDISGRLRLRPGSARLETFDASLYSGRVSASGSIDLNARPGRFAANARLDGVDAKALLSASQDITNVEGRIKGSLDLSAAGHTPGEWIAALDGPVRFSIAEPVIRELSIEELLCSAVAQTNRESLSTRFEPVTRFENMDLAVDFTDGVGSIGTLSAAVPSVKLRGQGRVNLPQRDFDIQLYARVTEDLERLDRACRLSRKMLAVDWPISCKGAFDDEPKKWCGIDSDDIAAIAAQLAVDSVQDKLLKKLDKFLKRDD